MPLLIRSFVRFGCFTWCRIAALCLTVLAFALQPASARAAGPSLPPAYRLIRTIVLPGTPEQGWDYLACDAEAHRVYVSHGPEVDVIDTVSGQLSGAIGGLSRSHGIALDEKDGRGFITDGGSSNQVVVFDLATLRGLQRIPVAAGPDAIVYDPISGRVLAFSGEARIVTIFDAKTCRIFAEMPLPGRPEFAAADRHGLVYDNLVDRNEIVEIDPRVMVVGNTYPTAPGAQPTAIAVDLKKDRLFSGCSNQTLIAMDATSGMIYSSLPIGAGVDACAYDPELYRTYASSGRSGTIAVITGQPGSGDQYMVAATISTLPGARTMTVDTKTHHLFTDGISAGKLVLLEYAPVDE